MGMLFCFCVVRFDHGCLDLYLFGRSTDSMWCFTETILKDLCTNAQHQISWFSLVSPGRCWGSDCATTATFHILSSSAFISRTTIQCYVVWDTNFREPSPLFEKLPVMQLLKNFSTFYGIRRCITVFTRSLHWSLSWSRSVQSIPIWIPDLPIHATYPVHVILLDLIILIGGDTDSVVK
jgi:hypothetical protein